MYSNLPSYSFPCLKSECKVNATPVVSWHVPGHLDITTCRPCRPLKAKAWSGFSAWLAAAAAQPVTWGVAGVAPSLGQNHGGFNLPEMVDGKT